MCKFDGKDIFCVKKKHFPVWPLCNRVSNSDIVAIEASLKSPDYGLVSFCSQGTELSFSSVR